MIAQFNALLIMALHHGQQDPTIAHIYTQGFKITSSWAQNPHALVQG